MKAISPMIAIVLLVAFTVAIGSILSIWLTGLTQTQAEETGATAQKISECAGVGIKLELIDTQTFKVTHISGSQPLENVVIEIFNATGNRDEVICTSSLSVGGICLVNTNILNPRTARATGICAGEVSVFDEWP